METETGLDALAADETSQTFLGQWHRLVSTTNWEKGRIICEWRAALEASGAAAHQYSDEAWSRRVGHVTGQHAGRLRRVCERFAEMRDSFPNLYWSHFQAALDWNDAELWLEGAVQNDWSIAEMRAQRAEAFGSAAGEPHDDVAAEIDEDFAAPQDENLREVRQPGGVADRAERANVPSEPGEAIEFDPDAFGSASDLRDTTAPDEPHPLESLPTLPDDLAEAFESFKLAILRHKLSGWQEVGRDAVLASLDGLRRLALTAS